MKKCDMYQENTQILSITKLKRISTLSTNFVITTKIKSMHANAIKTKNAFFFNTFELHFTEPVGAKAPTTPVDHKFMKIERRINHSLSLLCPAQSFPVPVFRFVNFIPIS